MFYVAGGNGIQQGLDVLRSRTEFSKGHIGGHQYESSIPHLIEKTGAGLAELLLEATAEDRRIRYKRVVVSSHSFIIVRRVGQFQWKLFRNLRRRDRLRKRPVCTGAPAL